MIMHFHRVFFIFFAVAFLGCGGACGVAASSPLELGGTVQMQGFRTSGVTVPRGEDGVSWHWELSGKHARMQAPLFQLEAVTLRLESPRGCYIVESPRCTFDQQTRQLRSDAAVRVHGSGVEITGIGYDFYLDESENSQLLVIRKAARVEFESKLARGIKEKL